MGTAEDVPFQEEKAMPWTFCAFFTIWNLIFTLIWNCKHQNHLSRSSKVGAPHSFLAAVDEGVDCCYFKQMWRQIPGPTVVTFRKSLDEFGRNQSKWVGSIHTMKPFFGWRGFRDAFVISAQVPKSKPTTAMWTCPSERPSLYNALVVAFANGMQVTSARTLHSSSTLIPKKYFVLSS